MTDGSSMDSLLEMLQDNAHSMLSSAWSSGAALLSDLQQQIVPAQNVGPTGNSSSSSSRWFWRQAIQVKEEALAYLRWSTPLLQPNTHIPLPTQWDSRALLALLDLLHSAQRTLLADSSSGSSHLSIPPVTAALVSLLLLVFTRPGGVALRQVALSPYCVLDKHEYWRLLSCHLVHLDLAHLLTNLSALLPDCSALEEVQGPAAAAADLLLLGLAASSVYVAAALLHKELGRPGQYYSMVTVGASSLGFALKVWSGCRCRGLRSHSLLGLVPLPPQFTWAPTLALTHLLVPQASFTAHMAGVCAGLCRAYAVEPVLQALRQLWRQLTGRGRDRRRGRRLGGGQGFLQQQQQQQQQQYSWQHDHHRRFLGSQGAAADQPHAVTASDTEYGVDSSGVPPDGCIATGSSSSSSSSWSSSRHWVWPCGELLLQLALVGAATGVYVVCTSGSSGQHGRSFTSSMGLWRRG